MNAANEALLAGEDLSDIGWSTYRFFSAAFVWEYFIYVL